MAGYNMMYSYKRVIFFIFLLILALTVTHVVKTPDVVALSSISGKLIIKHEYFFSDTVNDVTVQITCAFLMLMALLCWGQNRP